MAFVYWITDDINSDFLTHGYVGITRNAVEKRLESHRFNYLRFCKDGKFGGCKKLYATIKSLGGWDQLKIIILCESTTQYCIDLEYKLRSEPEIGWNTRVGGEYHIMFKRKITEETKRKLAEVRKKWVMSTATRLKMSNNRLSVGNPMFGTPPWYNPSATKNSRIAWLSAGDIYDRWLETKFAVKRLSKEYPSLNFWSIDSMIRKFRKQWNPHLDIDWIKFRKEYDPKN